jgi:protein TonB
MEFPHDDSTHDPPARPAYRVPVGLPLRDEGRRQGAIISVLVHAVIIALLLMPIVFSRTIINRIEQGAGGAGPAGGGGGGQGGYAGSGDTIRFVRVTPQQVPTPVALPPIPKPAEAVIQPPVPQVTPAAPPAVKAPEQAVAPAPVTTIAGTGAGPGSGHDGTTGNGPGTGGGVGSGIGTGRGSGVGPGTGGGTQANYPPQPIEFFLPPMPPPKSVKGFQFTAEFDVDSTGKVLDVKFSETRDGDYNRRLASVLHVMRFRPGTRPDGTPLRMKAQVVYEF